MDDELREKVKKLEAVTEWQQAFLFEIASMLCGKEHEIFALLESVTDTTLEGLGKDSIGELYAALKRAENGRVK